MSDTKKQEVETIPDFDKESFKPEMRIKCAINKLHREKDRILRLKCNQHGFDIDKMMKEGSKRLYSSVQDNYETLFYELDDGHKQRIVTFINETPKMSKGRMKVSFVYG